MSIKGRKNFKQCPHKSIEIGLDANNAVLTCPKIDTGHISPLEVPLYESSFTDPQKLAYKDLKALAGSIICNTCDLSSFTPVELNNRWTDQAESEARRLQAEEALRRARAEIEHL